MNLIVGKNNVGKTALIKALWLYARRGSIDAIGQILIARDEIPFSTQGFYDINKKDIWNIKNLFSNRPDIEGKSLNFAQIGSAETNGQNITIGFRYFGAGEKVNEPKLIHEVREIDVAEPFLCSRLNNNDDSGNHVTELFSLERLRSVLPILEEEQEVEEFSSIPIRSSGLSNSNLIQLWDKVSLTNLEEKVVDSLKLISPNILKLNFVGNSSGTNSRFPLVRISNLENLVPLRSLGEGMSRLLGIALALANCEDGMLFIDEVEIGLHYSVLPDVWKLIFKTAKDLNVQVFATTHSYDCIQAFTEAAIDDEESEGNLIRLARNGDEIKAFTFDEKQLETITKDKIEVR